MCQIPFSYNTIDYNYCVSMFGKFQCKIVNENRYEECAQGISKKIN